MKLGKWIRCIALSAQWWHLALLSLLQKGRRETIYGPRHMLALILWVPACLSILDQMCKNVMYGCGCWAFCRGLLWKANLSFLGCGFWWSADFLEDRDKQLSRRYGVVSIHWYYLLPPLVGASFLKHKMFAMDMTYGYLELLLFIIPQSKYAQRRLIHLCPQPGQLQDGTVVQK